jgi:hypothetical protein
MIALAISEAGSVQFPMVRHVADIGSIAILPDVDTSGGRQQPQRRAAGGKHHRTDAGFQADDRRARSARSAIRQGAAQALSVARKLLANACVARWSCCRLKPPTPYSDLNGTRCVSEEGNQRTPCTVTPAIFARREDIPWLSHAIERTPLRFPLAPPAAEGQAWKRTKRTTKRRV